MSGAEEMFTDHYTTLFYSHYCKLQFLQCNNKHMFKLKNFNISYGYGGYDGLHVDPEIDFHCLEVKQLKYVSATCFYRPAVLLTCFCTSVFLCDI